ncbi:MAG: glutamine-synthetase adenylyltransferase, partial [Methylococcaceae bacterium]|nr:glutamine-synthetase adenylyltransferase [Methylococcaceae bacterium]
AGFLVSQIEAFEQYQLKQAWTWEHQALVRARFVAGDVLLGKRFHDVRAKVLARKRNRSGLKKEVREMRDKMRENLATLEPGLFDLKQGIGGIADIEFIVQFGVLLNAYKNRNLLKFSDTVHLLDILSESGFLRLEDAEFLKRAYFEFRNLGHRAALQERPAVIPENKLIDFRARVEQTWLRLTE